MSDLALQLIEENKKTKAPYLDLGNCGLTELPEELLDCDWLETLILSSEWSEYDFEKRGWETNKSLNKGKPNNIRVLPPALPSLLRLKKLIVAGRYREKWTLADLSPLKNLQSLQSLYVSETQVADLSPLKDLQSLKQLEVFSTQVADLSPLKNLQSLQLLYVSYTQVADLSPLKNLQSLQQLEVSSTQVADLSPLKNLQSLQLLDVSETQVADLSPLKNLQSLQSLYVSSTQVADLSPLKNLQSLQQLEVSSTQVADLSPLKNLQSLQLLYVSYTQVADLSPLKNLQSLQLLDVSYTQVADLSPLKNLQSLQLLDVSETQVADLSPLKEKIENGLPVKWETFDFSETSGIYIKGTPLDRSLIAAIKSGNEAVLKYLNKPKERLWEARVLLLGEPRAGKTTLRRKLRSPKATMPTDAESTKGIEIEVETYKCALKRADEVYQMQYHLWDFGGQDMYRLLHQLFVSEQAVYVIVTDTDRNKNEEEIDFWLETIQRLGKDKNGKYGPVILLQNPKTNREGSSFPDLKKRYKDLWLQQENFVINLNRIASDKPEFDRMELSRFRHFKKYLENSFHQLDHLGQDMPRQWVRIRKNLSKLVSENWITLEKFRAICEKEHIKEDKEQEDLLKIFHILGFVLHYDTGLLRGMIILNKEWATDALYRVLDDEIVRANNGWFVKADAKKIWHDKKYQDRESELLLLMQEFKLTYYNETSKKYIVPSKLPEDTEELPEWNTSGNVRLHLRYDWLPRPVATQLIVSLHDHIVQLDEKQQWIWRKGAVLDGKKLDLKDAQVRIMDNWRERQIEIHARGSSCELLIRTVMQKWREVHSPYEDKVSVSKIILCNCEKCQTERQPFEFQYEQVLNAKEKNKPLRCNNSLEDFDAADILRGVFDETTVLVDTLQFKGSRSELLDFIAAGNLEEPLNRLHNSENTLALKARFSHLKDRQIKGVISPEDFNLEWNQLALVLIQYIEGLQNRSAGLHSKESFKSKPPFGDAIERASIQYTINIPGGNVNIGGIHKVKYSPKIGISKADFETLQEQIQNLKTAQQAILKVFIEELPEPKSAAEKETIGDRIINFINDHSLPITQNLAASAMYDPLKYIFQTIFNIGG